MIPPQIRCAALCIAILAIMKPALAMSCSCDGQNTVWEEAMHAAIVFKGVAVSSTLTANLQPYGVEVKSDTSSHSRGWANVPSLVVRMRVERLFKGLPTADTITVITPMNGAGCGVSFRVGGRYIVYGTTRDELSAAFSGPERFATGRHTFWTHLCSRTSEWDAGEEAALIALRLPAPR